MQYCQMPQVIVEKEQTSRSSFKKRDRSLARSFCKKRRRGNCGKQKFSLQGFSRSYQFLIPVWRYRLQKRGLKELYHRAAGRHFQALCLDDCAFDQCLGRRSHRNFVFQQRPLVYAIDDFVVDGLKIGQEQCCKSGVRFERVRSSKRERALGCAEKFFAPGVSYSFSPDQTIIHKFWEVRIIGMSTNNIRICSSTSNYKKTNYYGTCPNKNKSSKTLSISNTARPLLME